LAARAAARALSAAVLSLRSSMVATVDADEKLTAFVELESAIRTAAIVLD